MGGVGVLRTLFGVIVFVGFIGFLVIGEFGVLTSDDEGVANPTRTNLKSLEVTGRERHDDVVHPGLDPNYMSKRKVPNGPDPIHNRRAGNSGRPPGQA